MDFISQHLEWIIGIIVVGIFVVQAARVLRKAKKIDRDGIETDAVVSRVEELWDPDTASSTYTIYVKYYDENGKYWESAMALSSEISYDTGERVRIRFLPGDYELVRPVR